MTSAASVFSFSEISGWEMVGRRPRGKLRNNGTSVLFLRLDHGRVSDRASANRKFQQAPPADRSAFDRRSLRRLGQPLKRRTGDRSRYARLRGDQRRRPSCPLPHQIGEARPPVCPSDICAAEQLGECVPFDTDTPTPPVLLLGVTLF